MKPIIQRLLDGDTVFVVDGTASSGPNTVRHWYAKVKAHGKYLHTRSVAGGVEMWADDEAAKPAGRGWKRDYR